MTERVIPDLNENSQTGYLVKQQTFHLLRGYLRIANELGFRDLKTWEWNLEQGWVLGIVGSTKRRNNSISDLNCIA